MSTAERFLKRFESNISQSLGVRDEADAPGAMPPQDRSESRPSGPTAGRLRARSLGHMDIRNIAPDPGQPRKDFDGDSLERLSRSIAKFGQLLPIRVRWDEPLGKWLIISGERRYRAALLAGLEQVTCHFVDDDLSGSRILEEQVVENALREDLKPVEQARAYQALMDANDWSARKVADELHVASSTVVKALALLRIPEDVQGQVDAGLIPATAAYELAKLDGTEAQREAAGRITGEKMSREEAVLMVKRVTRKGKDPGGRETTKGQAPPAAGATVPQVRIVSEEVREEGTHVEAEYCLSNDVRIRIRSANAATVADVVAAFEAAIEGFKGRGRSAAAA